MRKELWEWMKAIVAACLIAFLIHHFIFATSIVEGTSMEPTLEDGERVIYNKFVYQWGDPERGDIVIIQHPNKNYVKRVIGEPGDSIQVKGHELYINDRVQSEDYLSNEAMLGTEDFTVISVPANHYFVMGDNRGISKDSRNGLGFINREDIVGKSAVIIYPFDEFSFTH